MAISVRIGRPGQFAQYEDFVRRKIATMALVATDRAARGAAEQIRAGLPGRLGGALGSGSDKSKNGHVKDRGRTFSASGWVYVRGKPGANERAQGAIISATEGAEIVPVRSPWLWIATPAIPQRAGRKRMTPRLYRELGFEQKIGPLIEVPGRHRGESLLVVFNVSVDRFGRPGRAKRLPRRGAIGASRQRVDRIVAFVGLRKTSRSRVVDARAILAQWQGKLPDLLGEELRKLRGG